MRIRLCIESGKRRVFASALDWPGWCRSGRNEQEAIETLASYAERYSAVPASARLVFATGEHNFEVTEWVEGNATTDFGAPDRIAEAERAPLDRAEPGRIASLVEACQALFDQEVASAPAELRKGPRGGGRDRDQIASHVADAELAYCRKLGIRLGRDLVASRAALLERFASPSEATPSDAKIWPLRYGARRLAWHVLDHAWEIEDKS